MKKINIIYLKIFLIIFINLVSLNQVKAEELEDGIYIIRSSISNNYVLDLNNASTNNGTNIQLYNNNNTDAQKWYIKRISNNNYTIATQLNKNMVIDVAGGIKKDRTNIQLYHSNNTKAQSWNITKTKDGYYQIASNLDNNYLIDLSNGATNNRTNIHLYHSNNTKAQKWIFEKIELADLDSGDYTIKSSLNKNYTIDLSGANVVNNSNIQLYYTNNTKAQKWHLEKNKDNTYTITSSLNNNYAIDVSGANTKDKTNIQLYHSNNTKAQKWRIYKTEDGYYSLATALDFNKFLDLNNATTANGANIHLYHANNTKAQKWLIEKDYPTKEPVEPSDNYIPEQEKNSNFTNLVIFAKFNDDNRDIFNASYQNGSYSANNWTSIKNMYNKNVQYTGYDDSFKNYINTITEGKINVNNVFIQQSMDLTKVNTYTLKKNKQDYSSGDGIVSEIIEALKQGKINNNYGQIKYDNAKEGILDNLTIIIQGESNANSINEDLLVNHKANYGSNETINNKQVSSYIILNSATLVSNTGSIAVGGQQSGVIAHEFLHTLGLPDLYRKTGTGMPVGPWDIMASVSYLKQYPLAYLRAKQGWIKSKTITKSGTYTLNSQDALDGNKVFILKTPLSDSEEIVLEYRKKATKLGQIDYSIPSSGLLMYRVDNKIEDNSNIKGDNYIYVYRPNITDKDSATDNNFSFNGSTANNVYNAALNPDNNKTSYGSTNLASDFTENTLYYSSGQNSGIKISNVKYSSTKQSITFDIDFANYENKDIWKSIDSVSTKAVNDKHSLYLDENNNIYVTYYTSDKEVYVKKYTKTNNTQLGDTIKNSELSTITTYKNNTYLAVRNARTNGVDLYILKNNAWQKQKTFNSEYAQDIAFIKGDNNLYLVYNSTKQLKIVDIDNNKELASKNFSYLTNPKLTYYNNKIYIAYSDYFNQDNHAKLISYNMQGELKEEVSLDMTSSNIHDLKVYNNELYALYGKQNTNPILLKCTTSSCNKVEEIPIKNYLSLSLNINKTPYITYIENNTTTPKTKIVKLEDGKFMEYNNTLELGITNLQIQNNTTSLYALYNINNNLYLKTKQL